jgi:hypothetical protein
MEDIRLCVIPGLCTEWINCGLVLELGSVMVWLECWGMSLQ